MILVRLCGGAMATNGPGRGARTAHPGTWPPSIGQVRGMTKTIGVHGLPRRSAGAATPRSERGSSRAHGHGDARRRRPRALGAQHPAVAVRGRRARHRPVCRPRESSARTATAGRMLISCGAARCSGSARGARAGLPARGEPVSRSGTPWSAGPGDPRPGSAGALRGDGRRMLTRLSRTGTPTAARSIRARCPSACCPASNMMPSPRAPRCTLVGTAARYEKLAAPRRRGQQDAGAQCRARAEIRRATSAPGSPARDASVPAARCGLATGPTGTAWPLRVISTSACELGLLPGARAGGATTRRDRGAFHGRDTQADWVQAGQALHRLLAHAATVSVAAALPPRRH